MIKIVKKYMDDKEEFLTKLGGPRQYRKALNELIRQRRLLSLEIHQLVEDAYKNDPELRDTPDDELNRKYHKGIFQLSVLYGSECKKSPYGMHAISNAHPHHYCCVWCFGEVGNWDTEQVHCSF